MAPTKAQIATRTPASQISGVGAPIAKGYLTYGCPHTQAVLESVDRRQPTLRLYELAVRLCLGRIEHDGGCENSGHAHTNGGGGPAKGKRKSDGGAGPTKKTKNKKGAQVAATQSVVNGAQKPDLLGKKIHAIKCQTCGVVDPSTLCCLHCSFVGCQTHLHSHNGREGQPLHALAVDLVVGGEGVLYCSECKDYIFDATFEQVRIEKIRQNLQLGLKGLPGGSIFRYGPLSLASTTNLRTGKILEEEDEEDDSSEENSEEEIDKKLLAKKQRRRAVQYLRELGPGYTIVQNKALLPAYQATSALRGFYNMGSTCFMSVIFQSLLHNPLVRNFYLSGGHERGLKCGDHVKGEGGNSSGESFANGASTPPVGEGSQTDEILPNKAVIDPNVSMNCLSCSLDEVFTEFFTSSSVAGFGPTELLTTAWQIKRSLGGNSQQDAHEFLQVVLNELHSSHYDAEVFHKGTRTALRDIGYSAKAALPETLRRLEEMQIQNCGCVAHRTFCGELESRLTCQVCGTVNSTVVDPIMDLSLDVRDVKKLRGTAVGGVAAAAVEQGTAGSGVRRGVQQPKRKPVAGKTLPETPDEAANEPSPPLAGDSGVTLEECLERFTSGEKLDATLSCETCNGAKRPIEKRLSIKRLPSVLAIQLKRFSHTGSSSKIETHVKFPLVLDMNQYTTGPAGSKGDGPGLPYELFGVVCHQGSLNTGHYTCMMKTSSGRWFHFDDAMVTTIGINQVLEKKAYLLFYIVQQVPAIV